MLNRHQRRATRHEIVLVTKPDDPEAPGAVWSVEMDPPKMDDTRRKSVPTQSVPKHVADAMLTVTQRRFYARWHSGKKVWVMGEAL